MTKRIMCKVHDDEERIVKVGVEDEGVLGMLEVWERTDNGEDFYTEENNKRAKVYARERDDGIKYLTSHPDGKTPNNLDELGEC